MPTLKIFQYLPLADEIRGSCSCIPFGFFNNLLNGKFYNCYIVVFMFFWGYATDFDYYFCVGNDNLFVFYVT